MTMHPFTVVYLSSRMALWGSLCNQRSLTLPHLHVIKCIKFMECVSINRTVVSCVWYSNNNLMPTLGQNIPHKNLTWFCFMSPVGLRSPGSRVEPCKVKRKSNLIWASSCVASRPISWQNISVLEINRCGIESHSAHCYNARHIGSMP